MAVIIGLSMLAHAWFSTGPVITISFRSAAGLTEGKTLVKFKDVTVGTVSSVELSEDGSHVIVEVTFVKSARSLVNAQTRFWVVRPRISVGGASGIDTLLSGAYIGVDKGASKETKTSFIGLEDPPAVISGTPGKAFVLHADDLGSLDINSPVYFRRIQVGRIASYKLDSDSKHVTLQAFINAPYDSFVNGNTRFWNASGVDIALNASGLKVNTQSLATVLAGGVAFATPDAAPGMAESTDPPVATATSDTGESPPGPPTSSPPRSDFVLAKDPQTAMDPPSGPGTYVSLRFNQSLRGLVIGAPVVFAGREFGNVTSVDLDYDRVTHRFPTIVSIEVFARKLGSAISQLPNLTGTRQQQTAEFLRVWVQNGLRAQVKSANLLTGQLYVSLDFIPNAPKVVYNPDARPLTLPTVTANGVDQIEEQISHIMGKVDKIPFDTIGQHLNTSLSDLDATLKQVNTQMLPEATRTIKDAQKTFGTAQKFMSEDAPLTQNLNQTLVEVQRSAQSVRALTDLLARHPEALLRGREKSAFVIDSPATAPALAPTTDQAPTK
ncbi:PqiB family protein [Caballeronia sordidicola]|uniref:PqiB family protein n=1 Tax=Caballeronia sordidicola TaxID=196367 RepID=UPI00211A80C2|nr:MlaD family protein [Caballeronia sordidicola]